MIINANEISAEDYFAPSDRLRSKKLQHTRTYAYLIG